MFASHWTFYSLQPASCSWHTKNIHHSLVSSFIALIRSAISSTKLLVSNTFHATPCVSSLQTMVKKSFHWLPQWRPRLSLSRTQIRLLIHQILLPRMTMKSLVPKKPSMLEKLCLVKQLLSDVIILGTLQVLSLWEMFFAHSDSGLASKLKKNTPLPLVRWTFLLFTQTLTCILQPPKSDHLVIPSQPSR